MITLARFKNKDILPHIGLGKPKLPLATGQGWFTVKASSNRLECLKRSQQCVRCRRSGSIWLLQVSVQQPPRVGLNCFVEDCPWCALKRREVPVGTETPHLNLYHPDRRGRLLLFTQDHIFPKHAGGSDSIENLQTMCSECNSFKGGMLPEEYERTMLPHERTRYSQRVDGRGQLTRRLEEIREDAHHVPVPSECAAE